MSVEELLELEKKVMDDGDLLLKVFGRLDMAASAWCGRSIDSVIQDDMEDLLWEVMA